MGTLLNTVCRAQCIPPRLCNTGQIEYNECGLHEHTWEVKIEDTEIPVKDTDMKDQSMPSLRYADA